MATATETQASLRTELKAAFDEKTHDGVIPISCINPLLATDTVFSTSTPVIFQYTTT